VANDIFGYLASFPVKFWHCSGELIHPFIKKDMPDDARLPYNFLEPVTLTPVMFAVDSRIATNLAPLWIRVRRFEESRQILKKRWQVIDEFFVFKNVRGANVRVSFDSPEPFADNFLDLASCANEIPGTALIARVAAQFSSQARVDPGACCDFGLSAPDDGVGLARTED